MAQGSQRLAQDGLGHLEAGSGLLNIMDGWVDGQIGRWMEFLPYVLQDIVS